MSGTVHPQESLDVEQCLVWASKSPEMMAVCDQADTLRGNVMERMYNCLLALNFLYQAGC